MDLENLTPAVDIENFDASKLDRGDNLEAATTAPTAAPTEAQTEEPTEAPGEAPTDEEGEPARDEKGKFAPKGIPKARFDEAVGKEREAREAAERRAAELERQLGQRQQQAVQSEQIDQIEAEIAALEKQHSDYLLDGEAEKAAAVMKQIRHTERQIARVEAEALATDKITRTLEAERVEVTIAKFEAAYPELNPQSENFDPDLVELILTKQRTLIQEQGMSPSKALEKAGDYVANRFLTKEAEAPEEKGLGAGKAADRKAEQVAKNLDTQKKQPPSMKDAGMDSDKAGQRTAVDVSKLTLEEFAALPESTKAKLRGDML